jgi:hypothetical protein
MAVRASSSLFVEIETRDPDTFHSGFDISVLPFPCSLSILSTMQVASPLPPHIPFHFFPKSSSSSSHLPSVVVKTRAVPVPLQAVHATPTTTSNLHDRGPSQAANALTTRPSTKRRSPHAHTQRYAKRARSSDSSDATPPPSRTRASSVASSISSRSSTRNRSSPPTSLPPSTRCGSRSSSVLPISDEPIPRECHIDKDAVLDDTFLSSEKVVLGLMKSYVQC